ncbi:hypothetical protein NG796_21925 [Laspinema sp. A4]|uniref:hypothetical protein n=1 Tax=Laspinema sp. D2d TaxID=2953686 RepID=UPI0021BA9998|nr:hypothetical protein [Laspinema sp. D2d]MCT7985940.1 hypothetical protein [Laspinema sp. D2d]
MSGDCKQTSGKLGGHSCDSNPASQNQRTLADWVNDYLGDFGTYYQDQAQWWGDRTLTWDAALERAWLSRFADGKKHRHQYRVPSNKLAEGLNVSRHDGKQAQQFKTFAELHDWVESVTCRVKGLGETTAYDVAQRLGMWLNLAPDLVYLHAGTAKGAALFKITGKTSFLSFFPVEIQKIGASHAENFLCIYKDNLKSLFK